MNNKERAKEELIKLVTDFKNNPDYYKKLSEADVEDKLVNELFVNILGWDKKDYEKRVKARRGNKSGSADYAFKINDRGDLPVKLFQGLFVNHICLPLLKY